MKLKYNEEMMRQYKVLDQYNFTPYLELYDDLDLLMYNFEYECDNSNLPEDFQGCVFNYCSTEDFIEYLKKRYPNYEIHEVTKYMIERK